METERKAGKPMSQPSTKGKTSSIEIGVNVRVRSRPLSGFERAADREG
jgi:hypothetical protein